MVINIQTHKVSYNAKEKTFTSSSKGILFELKHTLLNKLTGKALNFEFTHSTGSEWDNKTLWIYESECGTYKLSMKNDDVTQADADRYLNAKLKN